MFASNSRDCSLASSRLGLVGKPFNRPPYPRFQYHSESLCAPSDSQQDRLSSHANDSASGSCLKLCPIEQRVQWKGTLPGSPKLRGAIELPNAAFSLCEWPDSLGRIECVGLDSPYR